MLHAVERTLHLLILFRSIIMRKLVLFIMLMSISLVWAAMPKAWTDFQKDIGIQAAQHKDSATHRQLKESKNDRNYNVGDTHSFWRWNLSVMPPTWILEPSTCRAVGEYCYIFVADNQWNNHINQADIDTIMLRLEQNTPNNPDMGAIMMDVNMFGPIPDELDNDEKLIVFYSALGSFQGTSFDGYFSAYNQVTEAEAQQMNPPGHSNECEMIYMTCYPLNPTAPIRLSVLAHELQHLIHWGQDPWEETWLDEGCAELAMVTYGVPDPISGFNNNPDNDLTAWNQQTADYVKVMLFFTYLYEHYDDTGMIRSLVASPLHGLASLTEQLSLHYPSHTLAEIFRDWTIANVLDSENPGDGLYNYESLNLPNFSKTSVNTYPIQTNQTIQAYATDYLYYDLSWRPITFSINASNDVHFSQLLLDESGACYAVNTIDFATSIEYNPLPDSASAIIFVISNFNPGSITYSYAAGVVHADDSVYPVNPEVTMNCFPNPFRMDSGAMEIELRNIKSAEPGDIEIFNLRGQRIKRINLSTPNKSAEAKAIWNGKDHFGNPVSKGMYILRYQDSIQRISKSIFVN